MHAKIVSVFSMQLLALSFVLVACQKPSNDTSEPAPLPGPSVDSQASFAAGMADPTPAPDVLTTLPGRPPPPELDAGVLMPDGSVPPDFVVSVGSSTCLGACPSYRIKIDAEGNVETNAQAFTGKTRRSSTIAGCWRKSIGTSGVKKIIQQLNAQGFFSMQNPVLFGPTDSVHETLEVTMNGSSKTLDHNLGVDWPKKLEAQFAAIRGPFEQMTGVDAWLAHPHASKCTY